MSVPGRVVEHHEKNLWGQALEGTSFLAAVLPCFEKISATFAGALCPLSQ